MRQTSFRALALLIGFVVAGVLMLMGVTAVAAVKSPVEIEYRRAKAPGRSPRILNYHEIVGSIAYPAKCRSYGIEGTVFVKILVSKDGSVKEFKILQTPHDELSEACLYQIMQLKFDPAKNEHGEFEEMWVGLPITFKLKT